jgi:hypothetical protein
MVSKQEFENEKGTNPRKQCTPEKKKHITIITGDSQARDCAAE